VVPRLKLNLEDNDFFVRRILPSPRDDDYAEATNVPSARSSNGRLLTASGLAEKFIDGLLVTVAPTSHADLLLRWVSFIEKNAVVAVMIVTDEAGAYRMFET
jgi:hypothetical protein